ncbi:MAG: hypothetical protein QXE05_12675 [Nitrososphaeria archaeon]
MTTLDEFVANTEHKQTKKTHTMKNYTRREWSMQDLPYIVRKDPKKFVEKCKLLNNSEDIKILISLIENGSADLKKYNGRKKTVVVKGIEPYSPYLLWNLYQIYKKNRSAP